MPAYSSRRGRPQGSPRSTDSSKLDTSRAIDYPRSNSARRYFSADRPPEIGRATLISMPLGLAFETDAGGLLRLVLTEKGLSLKSPGTPIVLAAALAYVLSGGADAWVPVTIEVFHLRDADYRRFPAGELMTRWPRLAQLLTWAEGKFQSPAA